MQGQFWKNFRPRAAAALPPHAFPAPARSPPGTSRHETGPSSTFGRHCLTIQSWAKIKPQVDGLRFSLYTGYGRRVGVKRSRWAGFVAVAWRTAGPKRYETGKRLPNDRFPANCTTRWHAAPFPSSFGSHFCTYSANPSVNKGFARSHQAAQHR